MDDLQIRALAALRRLRRVETGQVRRDLAEALARETALAERDAAIAREIEDARHASGEFDREVFSAWLGQTRGERARLMNAGRDAETRTASARDELANRRVAETAAAEALAKARAARQADAMRRDQVTLEDVARALKDRAPC